MAESFWIKILKLFLRPLIGSGLGNIKLLDVVYKCFVSLLVPKRFVIKETNGCKIGMDVGGDAGMDSLAMGLFLGDGYEKQTTKIFKSLVKPGMTVVDVGAYIGYFALMASKLVGYNGRVWAFEPEPRNFANLVRNIELNGFDNVFPVQKAVSDRNWKAELFVTERQSGECSLVEIKRRPHQTVTVDTVTLDSFLKNVPVDIIKADIDGGEMAMLLGSENLVRANTGLKIFTELWELGLRSAGYSCADYWLKLKRCGFRYIYLLDEKKQQVKIVTLGEIMEYCHGANGINLLCSKEEVSI